MTKAQRSSLVGAIQEAVANLDAEQLMQVARFIGSIAGLELLPGTQAFDAELPEVAPENKETVQ